MDVVKTDNGSEWQLSPYTAVDGIPTFSDSFIMNLFRIMEDEELVGTVFYEGMIDSPDDFLKMMKFGTNSLYVLLSPNRKIIGGFVWLNNFQKKSADVNFCFFSSIRGKDAVTVGRFVALFLLNMKNMENEEFLFDVLIGITPETNILALKWCKKMGFGKAGIIPNAAYIATQGHSVPCHVHYAERGLY